MARALGELAANGLLVKHLVASLFRVTWGYLAAVVLAVPFGLLLGWRRRGQLAVGPLLEVLRPISPLAWIPISILWFGVGDLAAVFIIFLASFLPLAMAASHARAQHLGGAPPGRAQLPAAAGRPGAQGRAARRPAAAPRRRCGSRSGIAWLVVVAAEMIAVNSGLGFLIVDARNAGNRYDLVVAGMALIGARRPGARRRDPPPGAPAGPALGLRGGPRMMPVAAAGRAAGQGADRAASR